MFNSKYRALLLAVAVLFLLMSLAIPNSSILTTQAADHAEAPFVAYDPLADIADVYAFLDPNDNSKVILAIDVAGFIVPAEALNLCCFPPDVVYRLEIENTGDNKPDQFIDITFEEEFNRRTPQKATIKLPGGKTFQALSTVQVQRGNVNDVSNPNPFRVTTDPTTGVAFYAGLTDDPFFFDIIGFNRYVIKLVDRNPTAKTDLTRGRDSFGGFNIHMIALSVPLEMLKGNSNIIGVNGVTLRPKNITRLPGGRSAIQGNELVQVDRMATPVINTVLITTIQRKNQYNATPASNQAIFAPDIAFTFRFIRTSDEAANAVAGLLAKGDYIRLDLSKPNTSLGVGEKITDPGFTGFPNGRRPGDDTIDTILFFVNSLQPLDDGVPVNDKEFTAQFPFFAPPHQGRRPGEDDSTAF
jgi:hypothetical protein